MHATHGAGTVRRMPSAAVTREQKYRAYIEKRDALNALADAPRTARPTAQELDEMNTARAEVDAARVELENANVAAEYDRFWYGQGVEPSTPDA
jgi:hypothetical protein